MIEQDGRQTLSDHIPVTVIFVLNENPLPPGKRSRYYKMDVNLISTQEIVETIEEHWAAYHVEYRDPRINWDLGWGW